MTIPMRKDMDCAPSAASKDIRAPAITLSRTLLPNSSVPKRQVMDGGEREKARFISLGPCHMRLNGITDAASKTPKKKAAGKARDFIRISSEYVGSFHPCINQRINQIYNHADDYEYTRGKHHYPDNDWEIVS